MEPTARMTILTPISAHSLNGRSVVLSSEDQIEIEVMGHVQDGQSAVFDGDSYVTLEVGDPDLSGAVGDRNHIGEAECRFIP